MSKRFRAASVGGLLIAVLGVSITASPAASAQGAPNTKKKAARCDGASGWGIATGVPPTLVKGGPLGLYVWNQRGVWRVSVTNPEKKLHLFQGSISFDAPVSAKPIGLEGRSDSVVVGNSAVSFTFKNFGQLDGIGVEAPCATTVNVTGTVDGLPLAPAQVFLGSAATNPTAVPFFLRKEGVADPTLAAAAPPAPSASAAASSAAAAAPVAAPAAPAAACSTAAWPPVSTGRPAGLKKFKGRSMYAWVDKAGWNFNVTGDSGKAQVFEGRVTFNAPVTLKVAELEENDQVWLDPTSTIVSFSLKAGENFDAFVVTPGCATLFTVEVVADGQPLPPAQLKIGAGTFPATTMPYVISR